MRYEWCVRLHKAGKEGSGLTGDVLLDVWEKGREEGLDGREPGQEMEATVGSGGLLSGHALAGFKWGGGRMCLSPGGKCCICDRKKQHITTAVCQVSEGWGPD